MKHLPFHPYFAGLTVPAAWRLYIYPAIVLSPLILLGVVVFQPWIDPKWMFFDPLTAAEFSDDCCHVYYGFVSNLGLFLWVGTAAIGLFSAFVFYILNTPAKLTGFALSAGLLSGWLALDDGFLLHEIVLPKLGIPQVLVLALYVGLGLLYVWYAWRVILSGEAWLLGLAAVGFGLSLSLDIILHSIEGLIVVAEDSAKFAGIFYWFSFHAITLACIMIQPPEQRT